MVDSCRECVNCRQGEEQFCLKGNTLTYDSVGADGRITQAGYSTHVVVTEDFVSSSRRASPSMPKKRDDGLRLGADHYYATSEVETFE